MVRRGGDAYSTSSSGGASGWRVQTGWEERVESDAEYHEAFLYELLF